MSGFDFKHCPKCKKPIRLQVNWTIDIPAEFAHQMSKGRVRSKKVWGMGIDWPNAIYYCENEKCRGFMFRLGKKPCGCGGRFINGAFVHAERCDRDAEGTDL